MITPAYPDEMAPKYSRLKHLLRAQVSKSNAGDALPSEWELCQKHGVSRTTVRKAIGDLIQEGLVYTVQGKGTFVAPRKLRSGWVQQTGGLYADMTERGFKVRMQVLEVAVLAAEENIQSELQLDPAEPVVKLVRLRFIDENPFDIVTNYLPAWRFPGLESEDFERSSLYAILRSRYQVRFERGVRLVEAGACPPDEARLLKVKTNTPILIMRSTMVDETGRPFEHGIVHQRSDIAQIEIEVIPR